MTITQEEFTTHLNQLRAGIEEDKLVSAQFNDPISPEVVVLDTLVRSYDENAALRERVEALEWLVECEQYNLWSHPMSISCFDQDERAEIYDVACREFCLIREAAREAIK